MLHLTPAVCLMDPLTRARFLSHCITQISSLSHCVTHNNSLSPSDYHLLTLSYCCIYHPPIDGWSYLAAHCKHLASLLMVGSVDGLTNFWKSYGRTANEVQLLPRLTATSVLPQCYLTATSTCYLHLLPPLATSTHCYLHSLLPPLTRALCHRSRGCLCNCFVR